MDIAKLRKKAGKRAKKAAPVSEPAVTENDFLNDEDEFMDVSEVEDAKPLPLTASLSVPVEDVQESANEEDAFFVPDYDDDDDYDDGFGKTDDAGLLGAISGLRGDSDLVEYLSFIAAGEPYAFEIARVVEIIKPREVSPVPRSPEYIHGILSLRGEMIPVIDLMVRLKLRSRARMDLENREQPRIIILSRGENKVGLYVDDVDGVIMLDESEFEDADDIQGNREHRFLKAIGKVTTGFVIVLDIDEFFAEGESERK